MKAENKHSGSNNQHSLASTDPVDQMPVQGVISGPSGRSSVQSSDASASDYHGQGMEKHRNGQKHGVAAEGSSSSRGNRGQKVEGKQKVGSRTRTSTGTSKAVRTTHHHLAAVGVAS